VTPEQTELVRQSFDEIWPVRRKLAYHFYRRFFELAPDAQGLFRSDMERQYLKLMDMIAAIVGTLDKREMFRSIISHSGRQHAQFGAKPLHFAAFGKALGGLNGSTQHSILKGKDGVFGNASRLFSRLYGIRENRALGSLAAGRVAESDWASVW
jgi:hemoglobin-like flavoprotein